jgi:DNA mismatch repair protein MutH
LYKYDETWTEEKIYEVAKHLEGKTLGQLDKSGWLDKKKQDKGAIGNMIQSDFFGIPANSIKGPDFIYHDVELKVTPVLKIAKDFLQKKD